MVRKTKPVEERKKGAVDPELVQAAVIEVLVKKQKTFTAAKKYGIPRGTLRGYLTKAEKQNMDIELLPLSFFSPVYATRQILTEEQENALARYLEIVCQMHYGLTPLEVRQLACRYSLAKKLAIPESWSCNENQNAAGEDWYRGFMARHPHLTVRAPEATSLGRATAFNRVTVGKFFEKLGEVYGRHGFTAQNIWNVDETGLSTVHKPGKIVAAKGQRQVGKVTSAERGQNVTMCVCVSAMGNSVPPMLIFPRKKCPEILLKGAPPGTIAHGSETASGWMCNELFLVWMNHFISHARPSKDNPVLLILDNHISRYSTELLELAKENGVVMLTVPPHTTHKLQPLDRSVMFPLKAFYNRESATFMTQHKCKTISMYNVSEISGKAYPKALTPENIISGFRCTGIFPFDPNVFKDHEYLSSYVSDRPSPLDQDILVPPSPVSGSREDDAASQSTDCDNASQSLSGLPSDVDLLADKSFSELVDISPFPKGSPRKQIRRAVKKKSTEILTDTPVKERIRQEEELKAARKKKKEQKKGQGKKSAKKAKLEEASKQLFLESESESDHVEMELDDDSDNSLNLGEDEEDLGSRPIEVGDFILVGLAGKKSGKRFYAAKVLKEYPDELGVNFLKCVEMSKFVLTEEESCVLKSEVVTRLGKPSISGGTSRLAERLKFGVDLSVYKMG